MRYWWVNQNQTYRHEVGGGYLWSPKRNANGARNPFYESMREVAPGDLIFSFMDTRIALAMGGPPDGLGLEPGVVLQAPLRLAIYSKGQYIYGTPSRPDSNHALSDEGICGIPQIRRQVASETRR